MAKFKDLFYRYKFPLSWEMYRYYHSLGLPCCIIDVQDLGASLKVSKFHDISNQPNKHLCDRSDLRFFLSLEGSPAYIHIKIWKYLEEKYPYDSTKGLSNI